MKRVYIYIMCSLLATSLQAQDGFGSYLRNIIQKQEKGILVTAKLIEACGLCDSLDILMDSEYEKRYQQGWIPECINLYYAGHNTYWTPKHRLYGYTLFTETDDFWEQQLGKNYKDITIADVKNFVANKGLYPDAINDNQYDDENNMLNQFVTYHLLPRKLSADKLVNHINEYGYSLNSPDKLGIPVTENYVTMGKRRLLRTYESAESNGVYVNRFPVLDNGRQGTYHELSCDPDKAGIFIDVSNAILDGIPNAVIYPIDQLLAYSEDVRDNFAHIRNRYDIAGLFPEFSNNDIRLKKSTEEQDQYIYIPNSYEYPYLNDMTMNEMSRMCYFNSWNSNWLNLNGDEITIAGRADVTLRLPPVSKRGEYELRYRCLANADRGITQFYFGTDKDNLKPAGMPVDFTKVLTTMSVGYSSDSGNDYADQMVDNELYYNGYMKGAMSVTANGSSSDIERNRNNSYRYIVVRQTMDPNQTYYLRFKSVIESEQKKLFLDYIELCPKEVYDNPNEPEDIW